MTAVIGVLALQGDFAEHVAMLRSLGVETREVRMPCDLAGLDGLVIPGGESTTIGQLLETYALLEPVRARGTGDAGASGHSGHDHGSRDGTALLASSKVRSLCVYGLFSGCGLSSGRVESKPQGALRQ